MIFEPTGDLSKDYSAYCEIDQRNERDDILDGIVVEEKVTRVCIRNVQYCMNKRDIAPLCNAVPHCSNLTSIELTGCGMTEHSLKLLAEALYKSPSVHTTVIDFNPDGLFKDPTAPKKDKNEVTVFTNQFRGAHLKAPEPEQKDDGKKKPDPKKSQPVAAAPKEEGERIPVVLPTGWHGLLLSGIQVLSLRGNSINDSQVELIASLLEKNCDLISLNLWGNEISSAGVGHITKALQTNRRLTCLDLGHNRIDDAGVAAMAQIFLTMDVSNDDAAKLRSRTLGIATLELPAYPTYADLVAPLMQPTEEKKDPKKKEAPKKKGGPEGPIERLKTEFDKDCVRLDDNRVRVPGNTSLWCVSFAQNIHITAKAATAVIAVLTTKEPPLEEIFHDGNVREPGPYVAPIQLHHFVIEHTKLDKKHQDSINVHLVK